jgi:hypothetical protein
LQTVWYESKRAGLDVSLVLGLIQVESNFRKFAVSAGGCPWLHAGDAVLDAVSATVTPAGCFTCRPICVLAA